MTEEQAYEKLQELLYLVDDLLKSGYYDVEELKSEIETRAGK